MSSTNEASRRVKVAEDYVHAWVSEHGGSGDDDIPKILGTVRWEDFEAIMLNAIESAYYAVYAADHFRSTPPGQATVRDVEMRWARAATWARGQSLGPYGEGIDEVEWRRIECLRDRILEVGEDRAYA